MSRSAAANANATPPAGGVWHRLANPARFMRLARRVQPWVALATLALFAVGLYLALFGSPADYQQGETVRIMYVHVPAAWMAMMVYGAMALFSAVALIWKHALAHLIAQASAPIGAAFTGAALATGSLWGAPMWGAWWVWDARLTSVLILFLLYLGYIALLNAFDDRSRGAKAAAILCLVGAVNLPIIKFSVAWFNTLHQPASVARLDGPTIDPAMLAPLFVMAAAFLTFYITILIVRLRAMVAEARVRAHHTARRRAER